MSSLELLKFNRLDILKGTILKIVHLTYWSMPTVSLLLSGALLPPPPPPPPPPPSHTHTCTLSGPLMPTPQKNDLCSTQCSLERDCSVCDDQIIYLKDTIKMCPVWKKLYE